MKQLIAPDQAIVYQVLGSEPIMHLATRDTKLLCGGFNRHHGEMNGSCKFLVEHYPS